MTAKKTPSGKDAAFDLLEDADRKVGLENPKVKFPASMLPESMRSKKSDK
jgi:hypothetical protein